MYLVLSEINVQPNGLVITGELGLSATFVSWVELGWGEISEGDEYIHLCLTADPWSGEPSDGFNVYWPPDGDEVSDVRAMFARIEDARLAWAADQLDGTAALEAYKPGESHTGSWQRRALADLQAAVPWLSECSDWESALATLRRRLPLEPFEAEVADANGCS